MVRAGSALIGDDIADIEVTVIESAGGTMRLGIRAPRTTAIHRAELVEDVCARNTAATQADEDTLRALLANAAA